MGYTDDLAGFVAGLADSDLPASTVERAKVHLLDTLGVALGGSATGHGRAAAALIRELGGAPQCTVAGQSFRANPLEAAFANGTMAHGIDFDDGHKFVHPGCGVVPAALAAAEVAGAGGAALIGAVVAGYEVSIRVSLAAGMVHRDRGFHPTATCNVFGAAAAAGRLLGLSAEAIGWALGIALSAAGGTCQYRFKGNPTKHLHGGLAARGGLLAALLAARGYEGAAEPLEGTFGFLKTTADGGDPKALTAGLGERFAIEDCYIKPYPSCRRTHEPVDLALKAVREKGVRAEAIREAVLHTYEYAYKPWLISTEAPNSGLRAMLNTTYCLAAALTDGTLTLAQFDDAHLKDGRILALQKRIAVREDAGLTRRWPGERGARLEIALAGGEALALAATNPRGGPERPLSFDEVGEKFLGLAEPVIGTKPARQMMEGVRRLETLADVRPLIGGLAAGAAGARAAAE